MDTKTVYRKSDGTAVILNSSDRCPISGQWLIPGACTEVVPPDIEDGYKTEFNGTEWIITETEEQKEKQEIENAKTELQTLRKEIEILKAELTTLKSELNVPSESEDNTSESN